MSSSLNNKAEPKEVDRSKQMWLGFTNIMKCTIAVIVAALVLMAIFLV